MKIIESNYNGLTIVQNDEGYYGIDDLLAEPKTEVKFRYRTLFLAQKIAVAVSRENDMIDGKQ